MKKKKSKLQLKEKLESRNVILQHAKEHKGNRNSLNNRIIMASRVSCFVFILLMNE